MEPVLQKVKLCYSDGSTKMIDQIVAYQLEKLSGNDEVNFNILKGRFIDRVIPDQKDFDDHPKSVQACRYLLPCGKCDKNDLECSVYSVYGG